MPYATAPASASEGSDYEHKTGNYVFPPGDVSETVVFKVKGDTLFEPDETFSVVLTDPINGAPGPDMRGEITIDDDDSTPTPTLTNPSILEGNSGLVDLVFEATLAAPPIRRCREGRLEDDVDETGVALEDGRVRRVGVGVESSSSIVISPRMSGPGAPLIGSVSTTENVSSGSKSVSPLTLNTTVSLTSPGGKT